MTKSNWDMIIDGGQAVAVAFVAVTLLSALRGALGSGRSGHRKWKGRHTRKTAFFFGLGCMVVACIDFFYAGSGLWFSATFCIMGLCWFALAAFAPHKK